MAENRASQYVVEVLLEGGKAARTSQIIAEALRDATPNAITSQQLVEVLLRIPILDLQVATTILQVEQGIQASQLVSAIALMVEQGYPAIWLSAIMLVVEEAVPVGMVSTVGILVEYTGNPKTRGPALQEIN